MLKSKLKPKKHKKMTYIYYSKFLEKINLPNLATKADVKYDKRFPSCEMWGMFTNATCSTLHIFKKCPECGLWFVTNFKKQEFCTIACAQKFQQRKIKERNLKFYLKASKPKELNDFFKKFDNYVKSQIASHYIKYYEDMYDYWLERYPVCCFKLKKQFKNSTKIKFLNGFLKFAFLTIRKRKGKEISIYDCPAGTQIRVLGEYYER